MAQDLVPRLIELIRLTSTSLPAGIETYLAQAEQEEKTGSPAQFTLQTILENVHTAREKSTPICQDTGTPTFYVRKPVTEDAAEIRSKILAAVKQATQKYYLRPNAVDSITAVNSGDNLGGPFFPAIHFEDAGDQTLRFDLILKGGGCENVSRQYALPDTGLNAGRDLDGIRKAVLDAVYQAQGRGCAPGFLAVVVGGDRQAGYQAAKELFREDFLGHHTDPDIARLETQITNEANQLNIGPMGFGGRSTILHTRIVSLHRLPASFFVTVSYMCWAFRRRTLTIQDGKVVYS